MCLAVVFESADNSTSFSARDVVPLIIFSRFDAVFVTASVVRLALIPVEKWGLLSVKADESIAASCSFNSDPVRSLKSLSGRFEKLKLLLQDFFARFDKKQNLHEFRNGLVLHQQIGKFFFPLAT